MNPRRSPNKSEPSALEHLGRSLLGKSYSPDALFCMFTAYFDESGDKEDGFTIICGYVASVSEWELFEVDWRLFLIKFGVPYLHMKEFSQSKKCYAKWKGNETVRARFLGMASDIIACRTQRAFCCVVSNESFDKVNLSYRVAETFNSPYALAGRTCISLANQWAGTLEDGRANIEHVFEDGGPDKGGLINSLQSMPPFQPSPAFKPSRDVLPSREWPDGRVGMVQLQAADYLAYETGKLLRDIRLRKRRIRKSIRALARVPLDKSTFDEARLTRMFSGAESLSPGRFKRTTP